MSGDTANAIVLSGVALAMLPSMLVTIYIILVVMLQAQNV